MQPYNYKISQQRVWPYPANLKKGSKKLIVAATKLHPSDFSGPGAKHIHLDIVNDFNDFVFHQAGADRGYKIKYNIEIVMCDTLSNYNDDESYKLSIDEDDNKKAIVTIKAQNYIAAVRALATLSQLIRCEEMIDKDERVTYQYVIENTAIEIQDEPGVSHRAVMLDCARHFLSVKFIKKQIRAMAFQKLNILHLHLTDGQSFPLKLDRLSEHHGEYESLNTQKAYTETIALGLASQGVDDHNMGAYSPKEVYTNKDIASIVKYAKHYGIVVMPEIDTPGHTFSWKAGFPHIMTCDKGVNQTDCTCPEPPCGFFNLQGKENRKSVMKVVKGVFLEVIEAFKLGQESYGSYFHLGFDEVGCPNLISEDSSDKTSKKNCCAPSCTEAYGDNSAAYLNELLAWLSTKHKKLTSIMWIDQILSSGLEKIKNLQKDKVILQFWTLDTPGSASDIKKLAGKGFRIINSQAPTYYLDAGGQGNQFIAGGPIIGRSASAYNFTYQKYWISAYPGVSPCKGEGCAPLSGGWETSFEDIYLNNMTLLPNDLRAPLFKGYISHTQLPLYSKNKGTSGGVIGASIALWAELIDETNLEQKLWPKGAAFAEAMWKFNERRLPDNIINVRYRLAFTREDLLRLGIQSSPVVPGDLFRKYPWGPLGCPKTDLMHDINDVMHQQIPSGYIFRYLSHWYKDSYCRSDKISPINPFCIYDPTKSQDSEYMTCGGDINNSSLYVQPLCPQTKIKNDGKICFSEDEIDPV